ncbi:EBDP2, emopamil-binding protein [Venustampulla echinocandica]|uniref:EBDP2, emopamil-binding protein n=1 Tax=Venustampulla echinocandica TaxID=2656787 RepID=A0A370TV39_9HELO|nr:EBDP2, emopamil-binding protein [Venustampulla echinocandica]RDL39391.1 EBDP2, emopamil-binding protein [Venustampulla echinocandica]
MASSFQTLKMNSSSPLMITNHPYYPLEVEIASYLANEWSVPVLLGSFSTLCAAILLGTLAIVKRLHPNLPGKEKAAIWWFVLSGCIHLFFEGYFSYNHTRMGPAQDLFGQLWKEYALSDSRYLTSDPFVLCMETITAFTWGPLCFIVAAFITTSHPLRHPLQIIVCTGQIYGLILYYATSMFDHYYKEVTYSRPEFVYFWIYYFFINFLWMIFPGALLVSSVRRIANAFKTLEKMEAKSGATKKKA